MPTNLILSIPANGPRLCDPVKLRGKRPFPVKPAVSQVYLITKIPSSLLDSLGRICRLIRAAVQNSTAAFSASSLSSNSFAPAHAVASRQGAGRQSVPARNGLTEKLRELESHLNCFSK